MATQLKGSLDDRTLAAVAVQALREIAHRRRNRPDYEVYAHAKNGAAMVETLVMSHMLPDREEGRAR